MSATTRGDLNGLFDDLPRLPSEPPPPPPRHRASSRCSFVVAFLGLVAGATVPFYPMYHVPWFLFAVVGFFLWRRLQRAPSSPSPPRRRRSTASSVMDH